MVTMMAVSTMGRSLPGLDTPCFQKVSIHPFPTFVVVDRMFFAGSDISFPLLFTENLSFDLWPYMLDGDDGLGTLATS